MSIFTDISAALDQQLFTMAGLPPVAWENDDFEPTLNTLYLRPTLIAGDVNQATLGDNGLDMNVGIYQVDVFAQSGEGKFSSLEMADLIADHFKRGTDLTYNGRRGLVSNASRNRL